MVKLLFLDIDGTLTDGKLYIGPSGEVFKAFDVKDGYAIKNILRKYRIIPIIITMRDSDIVRHRCKELNITEIYQGCEDKKQKMIEVAQKYGIEVETGAILQETAYLGDDIPDLECIEIAQYTGCPGDAVEIVKEKVNYVCKNGGGKGAAREFIEWLVANA